MQGRSCSSFSTRIGSPGGRFWLGPLGLGGKGKEARKEWGTRVWDLGFRAQLLQQLFWNRGMNLGLRV